MLLGSPKFATVVCFFFRNFRCANIVPKRCVAVGTRTHVLGKNALATCDRSGDQRVVCGI